MNKITVIVVVTLLFAVSCRYGQEKAVDKQEKQKIEKTYFPDGALQKETKYSADGNDWEITKYFEDGTMSSHATYHNGKYVGEAVIYFSNGQKNFVQNYDTLGRPEGPYSLFTGDGILRESGNYVQGKKDGKWQTFDKDGKPVSTEFYKEGRLVDP